MPCVPIRPWTLLNHSIAVNQLCKTTEPCPLRQAKIHSLGLFSEVQRAKMKLRARQNVHGINSLDLLVTILNVEDQSGRYNIEVRLLFQSLSSRYVAELLEVDTPEVKTFGGFYEKANLAPEVISKANLDLIVP